MSNRRGYNSDASTACYQLIGVIKKSSSDYTRRKQLQMRAMLRFQPKETPKDALVPFYPHSIGHLDSRKRSRKLEAERRSRYQPVQRNMFD